MPSPVIKRSIVIAGHKTSVSLEDAFWSGLKEIAGGRKTTLTNLIGAINTRRDEANLSSAIRLYVLAHFRTPMTAASPDRVGNVAIQETAHNAHESF